MLRELIAPLERGNIFYWPTVKQTTMNIGYVIGIICCCISALYLGYDAVQDAQKAQHNKMWLNVGLLLLMVIAVIALAISGARKKSRK